MKIEVIHLKKDISICGLKKGFYNKDLMLKECKYMNFSDEEFFEFLTVEVLDPGTLVKYNGHKYYIISVVNKKSVDFYGRMCPMQVGDRYKVYYNIGTSTTVKEKDMKTVGSNELELFDTYWFINSSCQICQALKGENSLADSWRAWNKNVFASKEDAQVKFHEFKIMNK